MTLLIQVDTMPILAAEPTVFPNDLLTPGVHDKQKFHLNADRDWWVVYTRSRQEKAVARELLRYGVAFYLPLISQDRVVRGRRVRSFLPLFSGYLFLFGDDNERIMTLKTNRISRILPVTDPDQLCRDLYQVSQLIASDAPLTVERRLQPGQRVRIKAGPFRGYEGTLIRRQGRHRFQVAVSYLNQGVSIEIDDVAVEPL